MITLLAVRMIFPARKMYFDLNVLICSRYSVPLSGFPIMLGADVVIRLGSASVVVWIIKHLVSPLQRWVYRVTGGKILSNMGKGRYVLLLTTKGRRTGKDRAVPVFYLRDGEWVVI